MQLRIGSGINKELPKKRSHKCVVKKGKSLFEDSLTDDRLVRGVRRTKITPADLSTSASVLINIGCRSRASVNLSYAYIARHYHNITIKKFFFYLPKMDCYKKNSGALGRQN